MKEIGIVKWRGGKDCKWRKGGRELQRKGKVSREKGGRAIVRCEGRERGGCE